MLLAITTFFKGLSSNAIFYGLIALGISASVATGFVAYRGALNDARSERDIVWQAKLDKANAELKAEREKRGSEISQSFINTLNGINTLEQEATKSNEKNTNPSCAITLDSVRLLSTANQK